MTEARYKELKEEAQELIDCGSSREKAEGRGMLKVLEEMKIHFLACCEIDKVVLHLDELYSFEYIENCKDCEKTKKKDFTSNY